eukprot:Skav234098  [mRNA]  locus=scaffold183:10440:13784:- [translate_table: standard]
MAWSERELPCVQQDSREWYQKLAAGVDDNDGPRRGKAAGGKASLRGAAGPGASVDWVGWTDVNTQSLRRPGASLRNTASASGQSGDTEGEAPPGGALPPPPPRKAGRGPGPPLPGGPGPGPGPPGAPGGAKLKPNWAF